MKRPEHAEALRRVYGRVLAKVLAITRSLPDAEDAVQAAVERALSTWTEHGVPDSAEAWLLTVAHNAHRDQQRRARRVHARRDALQQLAELSPWARIALAQPDTPSGWNDELLRLLFACCHPALEEGESAALALATAVGLSNDEVAAAFVVAPRSMEQRLTRARQRLRDKGDAAGTTPERGRERLGAVLRTIHLLFNEGYWSSASDAPPIRDDLCGLALALARALWDAYPDSAEAAGLLALLLLHDARRAARLSSDGRAVPLPEQDRSRWDHAAIHAATRMLEAALAAGEPGPFQIEAAIAATHCRASTADDTAWDEIALLYALLERHRPTPAVRVQRAFALSRAEGPQRGLSLLAQTDIDAGAYPYFHLVRASLLSELGDVDAACCCFEQAVAAARNAEERRQLQDRLARLRNSEAH